ncbi:MAG: hypothetical protein HRT44_10105 [Bdellovibrionales bacterium]|nr:hypothetical protein [Bdellovibrionales bacterium]
MKQIIWESHANTSSRIQPSYYRGRPFLAIVDFSQIDDPEILENAGRGIPTNVGSGYRHIGFHYKIDDDGLKRGFESHGCIRLQDRELYMLNSIINHGPRNLTPVEVKKVLPYYSQIDAVYKTQEKYEKVVYSSKEPSPRRVHCLQGAPYPVRFFENEDGTNKMHTLADKDCLSQLSGPAGNMEMLQDYLLGNSQYSPELADWGDAEHAPISYHNQVLMDNKETLRASKPEYASLQDDDLNKTILEMDQKEKRDLVAWLKPQLETSASNTTTPVVVSGTEFWPVLSVISSHPRLREYLDIYNTYCLGKRKVWRVTTPRRERPGIRNCEAYYDVLIKYGAR